MEGRLLEKSGWCYGSSDSRGSSERHRIRSEARRALGGSVFYEFWLGVFYIQHQSLYFRVRISNEGSTEKFSQLKLPPSISALSCCQIF